MVELIYKIFTPIFMNENQSEPKVNGINLFFHSTNVNNIDRIYTVVNAKVKYKLEKYTCLTFNPGHNRGYNYRNWLPVKKNYFCKE